MYTNVSSSNCKATAWTYQFTISEYDQCRKNPEVSHTLSHLNTEAWLVSYAASRLSKGEMPWVRYRRTRPDSPTPGSSWIVKGMTTWTQFQTCHCLLVHLVITDTSLHKQKQLVKTCYIYLFLLSVIIIIITIITYTHPLDHALCFGFGLYSLPPWIVLYCPLSF